MDLSLLPAWLGADQLRSVESLLSGLANPAVTTVRVGRVLQREESRDWALKTLFTDHQPLPLLEILCRVLSQSEFLTSILEREPALLTSFQSERDFGFSSSLSIFEKELYRHLESLKPGDPFKLALTRFKLHEVFRVAVRDIMNYAPIETLARELSDLADLVLQAAYEKVYADTLLTHGVPRLPDGSLAELAILSLGKHGSRELNFSSDLDLILLYGSDGKTDLTGQMEAFDEWTRTHPFACYQTKREVTARTRSLEFEAFFTELGTRLIDLVSDPSLLGLLYRIDMRLRPEGAAGPLVRTLNSAYQYYQNWGQRWERQALLRARPTAGDLKLGERLLTSLEGFIYRKYVDSVEVDETLRDMRELRARSISHAGGDERTRHRNLKNGPGGIRDIEFLIQAIQNLYGAQYPEFRRGNLFEVLRRIRQSGLMSEKDYTLLTEGYGFLRRLEHRIQMDDMQRYHLPPPGEDLETLAVGMGYAHGTELEKRLFETMAAIHAIYQIVFRTHESEESIGKILDQSELTTQWKEILLSYGIREPETLFRSLSKLIEDPDAPHLNSKLRRLLKALLPRLFTVVRNSPAPDLAWRTFERLSLATPARSSFYSLAGENHRLLGLLLTIGAASPYLADFLASSFSRGDDLLGWSSLEGKAHEEDLEEEFEVQASLRANGETCLPCLRNFRTRRGIQIGGRFILGTSSLTEALNEVSHLADFCLRKCIEQTRFSEAPEMAVLALGKFGGMELGFGSDLDLLILYDDTLQSDSEVAQKLASDLVGEMSKRTEDGRLFEIDMRLRPHGKSAPLVPSVEGAIDYYHREGQTWERLMLSRSRIVWGEERVRQRIQEGFSDWVYGQRADEGVLAEVREMRARIEKEKPDQPLKCGPGGMLDVEFLTQAAQLVWGQDHPEIRCPGTLPALHQLVTLHVLSPGEAGVLEEGYLYLREIENRLTLLASKGAKGIPKDPELREHLARCMNLAHHGQDGRKVKVFSSELLATHKEKCQKEIREVYEAVHARGFKTLGLVI